MRGFDNKFKDFPDYILGITKEIWEDRGLSTLHHYYAPDIVVRSPSSIVIGNKDVIGATMATLAEFPDRTLLGEDVIWSGDPEAGMLSSHRILSTATHAADGAYGAASGTKLCYRIIADCYAKDNQISDEWLIRDSGAIARQLGQTPEAFSQAQIEAEGGVENAKHPFTPAMDQPGPYLGRGNDNEWGVKLASLLTRIMSAEFSVISETYDRGCHLEYAGGVTAHGPASADAFWLPLRASLPSAEFEVHHVIGREDPLMSPRAAVRWSLTGKHDGWGVLGAPTGADIHVMGLTHVEFGPYGIRREYTLYDETAVWKQILLHKG